MRFKTHYKKKPKSTKRNMYKPPNANVERSLLFWWASTMEDKIPGLDMLYHIPEKKPNVKHSSIIEQHNLTITGGNKGVPDICLPISNGQYHGLYIWLKQTKNNQPTKDHWDWIERLTEYGYKAVVCKRFAEAKQVIVDYLGIEEDYGRNEEGDNDD